MSTALLGGLGSKIKPGIGTIAGMALGMFASIKLSSEAQKKVENYFRKEKNISIIELKEEAIEFLHVRENITKQNFDKKRRLLLNAAHPDNYEGDEEKAE